MSRVITPEESNQIARIVTRILAVQIDNHAAAVRMGALPLSTLDDRSSLTAMIAGCHLSACRLDLKQWADADQLTFMRDFYVIRYEYDAATGSLKGPRRPYCMAASRGWSEPDDDLMAPEARPMHPGLEELAHPAKFKDGDDDEGEGE
ncbi:hypothetical protein GHK68_24375 [Sinorhizobium meliloti]|uniref:DUF6874 family protein n=1 Tax=Rhizobium meliloti TaxID=382 RepID=UPI0012949135|nr:hypothetical protein [Sinorhizobium meliloti]MQW45310.1 hypothetical protein [Sinorhizobium meliloti]